MRWKSYDENIADTLYEMGEPLEISTISQFIVSEYDKAVISADSEIIIMSLINQIMEDTAKKIYQEKVNAYYEEQAENIERDDYARTVWEYR